MLHMKIKAQDIFNGITEAAFKEALGKANNKAKGITDEELAKQLGLSEYQYQHFFKALSRSLDNKFESILNELFKNGDSLEVPHQFQVYVHESESRINEKGEPAKKLSVRTRRGLKAGLNQ